MSDIMDFQIKIDPNRKDHRVMPVRYMLVVGTITEGLTFYGPFDGVEDAKEWSQEHLLVGTQVGLNPMYYTPEVEE